MAVPQPLKLCKAAGDEEGVRTQSGLWGVVIMGAVVPHNQVGSAAEGRPRWSLEPAVRFACAGKPCARKAPAFHVTRVLTPVASGRAPRRPFLSMNVQTAYQHCSSTPNQACFKPTVPTLSTVTTAGNSLAGNVISYVALISPLKS